MMNKINHPSKFIKSKYKVAVVGSYAAGKTSLLLRFANGTFEENYHMTLRPSSHTKSLRLEDSLFVRLELIDTLGSGVSMFGPHSPLRDIDAVLLVYDVTNEQSFLKLGDLLSELKSHLPKDVLFALVGTHCDRPHMREVTPQEAGQLKKQKGISLFYEISAKTNQNVSELFHDLAKYLVIVGASREKQENPEVSTTYEEERLGGGRGAKTVVLEKKLAYKQEECKKLWKDYQDAVERISYLESRAKDDSSYILNYAGDTEELEIRIQQLEQQLEEIKTAHLDQKIAIEKQNAAITDNYEKKVQDLVQERERLHLDLQRLTQELAYIEAIVQQHQQSSAILLYQKNTEIEQLLLQMEKINEEKQSLSKLLINQIEEKVKQRLHFAQQEANFFRQIQQKEAILQKQEKQRKSILFLIEERDALIEQYELKITAYREEMVEMSYLEQELAIQHEKFYRMEITYQDNISKIKKQYETKIDSLLQEKNLILKGKEKVVSKIIQNKVNEIKLIRSFINQIDSKKEISSAKQPSVADNQQGATDAKMMQFFNQFIQLIQENSQYLHYNLETVLGSLESAETECEELLENTAKLDLSEVWYDLKEKEENSYLSVYIQKPEAHEIWYILNLETQKRVSKCITALQAMMKKMRGATDDLRVNLTHISESLEKVNKLSQVGIQAYVSSLND